jgi:lysophospholipase L1-like esterase
VPNNLTLTSPAYDTSGAKFGTAALSGGYGIMQSTTGALFGTGNTWTLECWAKRTGAPAALEVVIGSAQTGYIGVDASGHAQGSAAGMSTTVNVVDGAWHHLEMSSSSGGLILFVDGVSVATNATATNAPLNQTMGVRTFGDAGASAGFTFGGEVDETATWNIQRHATGFTPLTAAYTGAESGLTALWHLDSSGLDSTGAGGGSTPIAPNDAAINYSPYNWYANGATEAVSWNFCGHFATLFTGSYCALRFDVSSLGATNPPVINWRIDSRAWTRVPIAATVTLTVPSPSGTSSNTYHHLEVFVVSNDNSGNRFGATAASRLRFTGLTLASGAVVLQPVKFTQNVLIFGDSVVEGAQNITTDLSLPYTQQSDSSLGWAAFQREALGAEIGQVGWGSTGYTVGAADVPNFQTHWNLLATGISRPLTPEPDMVVINHGINDGATDITVAARTVVNAMLAQWPRTRIILLNPIVQPTDPQPRANPNTYLQAAAATCNDPARVTFLSTLGLYDYSKGSAAPGFHPSEANVTALLGRNLANLLRPYLAARLVKRWSYA